MGDTVHQSIRNFLATAAQRRGSEDALGIVTFDGRAIPVAQPSRTDVWTRELASSLMEGSNLAEGIATAASMIPADAAGRIVVFSDGNQTAGDVIKTVQGLRDAMPVALGSAVGRELHIDVVPLRYALESEVVVESVDAPPHAQAMSTVNVRVVLFQRAAATAC